MSQLVFLCIKETHLSRREIHGYIWISMRSSREEWFSTMSNAVQKGILLIRFSALLDCLDGFSTSPCIYNFIEEFW